MKSVLILADGKAGHENQSKAFARALGCEFDLVKVSMGRGAKVLTYLLDFLIGRMHLAFLKGLAKRLFSTEVPIDELGARGYAAVLGTGSGTFFAAKWTAWRIGVKCGVVLYPRGYDLAGFDCILAPEFDNPRDAPNIIRIPSNLVAGDEAFYANGVEAFRSRHMGATDNAVAVIVGGPNKCSTMSAAWMKSRLDEVFAENAGADLWVTTSRRTPSEVEKVVDGYPWAYKLVYSRDHFNPIPAFVSLAKRLYVTAESTGMLSEACMFGTSEVRVLDNLKSGPNKFRRFVETLRESGYIDGARKIDLGAQFTRAREIMEV